MAKTRSFPSSPEAPLSRGAVERSETERFHRNSYPSIIKKYAGLSIKKGTLSCEVMRKMQKTRPWAILAAGAAIQILTGLPAAWGVFQQPVMEEYGLTQEQVAQQMGKSRPAIANTLRLLALPEDILKLLEEEALSAGHARAILALPSPALQRQAAKKVIEGQLSVRQTEALVKALQKQKADKPKTDSPDLSLYLGELEKDLSGRLGRKVKIAHRGKKGKIELEYYNDQDLEALLALLQTLHGEGGVQS